MEISPVDEEERDFGWGGNLLIYPTSELLRRLGFGREGRVSRCGSGQGSGVADYAGSDRKEICAHQ